MNNVVNWFSRKRLVFISLMAVLVYFISYFNEVLNLPLFYDDFCCVDDRIFNLFAIFIPIFIFTIIFINLNEIKFTRWKKFTLIYLIIYLIIYFIVPTQGDGYIWFQKETVSFFGSILFLIVSLILILYKSLIK